MIEPTESEGREEIDLFIDATEVDRARGAGESGSGEEGAPPTSASAGSTRRRRRESRCCAGNRPARPPGRSNGAGCCIKTSPCYPRS
jgi:glycine cleavage system protein P-like pyridoxal-binding family